MSKSYITVRDGVRIIINVLDDIIIEDDDKENSDI